MSVGEMLAEGHEVGRFVAVVELGHQRQPELLDHVSEAEPAAGLGVVVGKLGDALDHLHVVDDLGPDVRTLDLHRDGSTVAQLGPVDLTERG